MHSITLVNSIVSDYKKGMTYTEIGAKNNLNKNQIAGIIFRYREKSGERAKRRNYFQ